MLSGNGHDLLRIIVQLFLAICRMHYRDHRKHHALVSGGQVIQKFLGFLSLLLHVVGDNGRKVVVHVLLSLPVGDVRLHTKEPLFHFLYRLVRRHRDHVDAQHHASVDVRDLRHHAVLDI